MNDLGGGDDGLDREICLVKVLNDPLGDGLRSALQRPDLFQSPIRPVDRLVERGHIDALNLGGLLQELLLRPALLFGLLIQVDVLQGDILSLPQNEEVHKGGQRLGVIAAGPPCHHKGGQLPPVLTAQGQTGQVQHVEHIGIGHLIAQREAHYVKFRDGVSALQTVEQQPLPAQLLFHVPPGGEAALTPDVLPLIHHSVENAAAQVGHTDLIGVGKTEGKADAHLALVFDNGVVLSAGIPGRLLYIGQDVL